jgi:tRNA(fMet)-specific endonuclease VapC
MAWLLDSNIWIHYLKNPQSPVRTRLEQGSPDDVRVCSVVKAELFHGARKYGRPERRLALVVETFAPYVSLPFDDAAAEHYARIRHELEIGGRVIGPNDLLIAAICLANDCTLVSNNVAEFQRVSGLRVEDWTAAR